MTLSHELALAQVRLDNIRKELNQKPATRRPTKYLQTMADELEENIAAGEKWLKFTNTEGE